MSVPLSWLNIWYQSGWKMDCRWMDFDEPMMLWHTGHHCFVVLGCVASLLWSKIGRGDVQVEVARNLVESSSCERRPCGPWPPMKKVNAEVRLPVVSCLISMKTDSLRRTPADVTCSSWISRINRGRNVKFRNQVVAAGRFLKEVLLFRWPRII